eukprot:m.25418 g.25418  ORF g.25418 m.25418 type:complete len:751 (-) comp8859_c0_seq1:31-2283(-)
MPRVAVIGSGIAGLSCAWLASDGGADVVLYEAAGSLGMDAHSADVKLPSKHDGLDTPMRIDVPLRVFSEDYYPNLCALYRHLGLELHREDYSASMNLIAGEQGRDACFFKYENFKVGALSICFVNSLRLLFSRKFFSIVYDCLRFFRLARRAVRSQQLAHTSSLTFGQWLQANNFSAHFVDHFIIPTMACVCTCSNVSAAAYPADLVIRYLCDRFHVGVLRVASGTIDVTKKLTAKVHSVRLSTAVDRVEPASGGRGGITVCAGDSRETFDHVVFATQANCAHKLLGSHPAYEERRAALAAFRYESSRVVLHTDTRLMPTDKTDWKPLNLFCDDHVGSPMATIWMNRAQTNFGSSVNVFQTWNPIKPVRADAMLSEASFERPVIDHKARQAQRDLANMQGRDGLWFCGAFVEEGIPLLEAGCRSGLLAAQSITGATAPWTVVKRAVYKAPCGGLASWVQAARLPAHPMIALPLLLGTLLYARTNEDTNWVAAGLMQGWGMLSQAFALFINDVADELTDNSNTTFARSSMRVSGGSRVIQENKLSADQLLVGSVYLIVIITLLTGLITFYFSLPLLPLLAFLLLFGAYSYSMPPISFVFNGWGEPAQGVLLGLLMPLTTYYCQSGALDAPLPPLIAACALFTASNIVTGLPDVPSDQASGKFTLAVRRGGLFARAAAVLLTLASLLGPYLTLTVVPLWCSLPVLVLLAVSVVFTPNADMATQPVRCARFVLMLSIAHGWIMATWVLALLLA